VTEEDDGLTKAQLARHVLVGPQSMGTLIDSLVARGLVVRDGPGGRGRRAGIALTDAGRETRQRARPAVRAFNTPAALGLTRAQAAMLGETFDHVRAAVGKTAGTDPAAGDRSGIS